MYHSRALYSAHEFVDFDYHGWIQSRHIQYKGPFRILFSKDGFLDDYKPITWSFINTEDSGYETPAGTIINNCTHFKGSCQRVLVQGDTVVKPLHNYVYGPYKDPHSNARAFCMCRVLGQDSFYTITAEDWYVYAFVGNSYTPDIQINWYHKSGDVWYYRTTRAAENSYLGFSWSADDTLTIYDCERKEYTTDLTEDQLEILLQNCKDHRCSSATGQIVDLTRDPDWDELLEECERTMDPLKDLESYSNCYRHALLNFKLHDSNFFSSLVDTFTEPTALLSLLIDYGHTIKGGYKLLRRSRKGKYVEVDDEYLRHLKSMSIKDYKSHFSKLYLGTLYGVKAPIMDLFSDNLWVDSLVAGLNWYPYSTQAYERIQLALSDQRLRAREETPNGYRSVNIYTDPVEDQLLSFYHALYRSGILPTFEGVWDLVPLSFVVDWVTNFFSSVAEAIDATAISWMVGIQASTYTRKERLTVQIPYYVRLGQGEDLALYESIDISYYRRYTAQVEPTTLYRIDAAPINIGEHSIRKIPQAIALLR